MIKTVSANMTTVRAWNSYDIWIDCKFSVFSFIQNNVQWKQKKIKLQLQNSHIWDQYTVQQGLLTESSDAEGN